jgi:Domain of unknown function (DUF4124)
MRSCLRTHRGRFRLAVRAVLCLTPLLAAAVVEADVYKWIDADGHVHFTDRPPPSDGRLVSVGQSARTVTPTETAAEPPQTTNPAVTQAPVRPAAPPPDAAAAARLKARVAADVAAQQAAACQAARERYQHIISARHLFRSTGQSDRVYLSDAEVEAARLQARRDVEELCGQEP